MTIFQKFIIRKVKFYKDKLRFWKKITGLGNQKKIYYDLVSMFLLALKKLNCAVIKSINISLNTFFKIGWGYDKKEIRIGEIYLCHN